MSIDRLFDPFLSDSVTENNLSYDAFEKIRVSCSLHLPEDVKNIITNNSNKLNIMHVNARSVLTDKQT